MKQRITIEIGLHEDGYGDAGPPPPYELIERTANGESYEALRRFFEDIGYKIHKLEIEELKAGFEHGRAGEKPNYVLAANCLPLDERE